MNIVHRAIIQQLIEIHLDFFKGSDFTSSESLEKNEYFRGQVEMIADMVGGCDAKEAIWEPLKDACSASARGENTFPHVQQLLDDTIETFLKEALP